MSRDGYVGCGRVVNSRAFRELSYEAQIMYTLLESNSNGAGIVVDPWMYADARGFDYCVFDELEGIGAIVIEGDECFIANFFTVNSGRQWCAKMLAKSPAFMSGVIGFEGDPLNSRYARIHDSGEATEELPNTTPHINDTSKQDNARHANSNQSISIQRHPVVSLTKQSGQTVACQCPKCGRRISMARSDKRLSGECDGCGMEWVYDRRWLTPDLDTGELLPFLERSA